MDGSSSCRRVHRSTGPAGSVRASVEPIVSIRSTLATSVAGVSFPPVLADRITGAGEPFLVAAELFKGLGGEELRAVSGWMTERLQEIGCDKNWNLVRFEAKKPCGLGGIEAGGRNLPTKKIGLF
jgi:hypothetical protein